MVTRNNLLRQAELLLRLARSAADPDLAASLLQRAADKKETADNSAEIDVSPRAPDVVAGPHR